MKAIFVISAIVVGILLGAWSVSADYGFSRFHPQGMVEDITVGWSAYRLRAICDVGNGTMVYIAVGPGTVPSIAIQPNGCAKVRVIAEKGEN